MKAILRQELIQVIARDTPRDLGIAGADDLGVTLAQGFEPRIDLAATPPARIRWSSSVSLVRPTRSRNPS
jgi:hypothetical protein